MSKQIVAAEISLENVPSHIRRIFGYNEEKIKSQLRELNTAVNEIFILSTNHRLLLYAVHTDISPLVRFFCRDKEIAPYVSYYTTTEESIHHLFATAGSLFSKSHSEQEMMDQLQKSYELCLESECLGLILNNLVTEAIKVGGILRKMITPLTSPVDKKNVLNRMWEVVTEETNNFLGLLKQFEISPVFMAYWTSAVGVKKQVFKVSENNKQWNRKYTREFNLTEFTPDSSKNSSPASNGLRKDKSINRLSKLYSMSFINFFQN